MILEPSFVEKFDGVIWDSIVSENGDLLIMDVRKEEERSVKYYSLDLKSLQLSFLNVAGASWWSKMEAYDSHLIISQYIDQNDPTNKVLYRLTKDESIEVTVPITSTAASSIIQPTIYEPTSDYFKTVGDFLGLDLPCSCEYLEWSNKIILSYYLRSGKVFDRHLLVLRDGKKLIKEVQDAEMKGFASGSFFVLNNQLIFVKNRNEIFVYPV